MAAVTSKYASLLPDIDSAPDVYETTEVSQEFSYEGDSDSDPEYGGRVSPVHGRATKPQGGAPGNEDLETGRLNPSDARAVFGSKITEASVARDGSSSRSGGYKTGRRLPSTSSYSIRASNGGPRQQDADVEAETSLERLRRLRSEVAELEEQVQREKAEGIIDYSEAAGQGGAPADAAAVEGAKGKGKKRAVSPAVILQQLQLLRGDLANLSSGLAGGSEGAPATAEKLQQKEQAASALVAELGGDARQATQAGSTTPGAGQEGLEQRLADLERFIGMSEADVDESNPLPSPLVQSVSRLDHLLTLLTQPRHLDGISRRVKVLVSDLERLHESRRKLGDTRPLNVALSSGMTVATGSSSDSPAALASSSGAPRSDQQAVSPEMGQKIDALFALLPRLDPLVPITPRILSRLQSLSSLHLSATEFSSTLDDLKKRVESMSEENGDLKAVVAEIQDSFKGNESRSKENAATLEERIATVLARMEKITAH